MPQVLPSDLSKIFLAKGSLRYQTEKGSLRPIIERSLRHERDHLDCPGQACPARLNRLCLQPWNRPSKQA